MFMSHAQSPNICHASLSLYDTHLNVPFVCCLLAAHVMFEVGE